MQKFILFYVFILMAGFQSAFGQAEDTLTAKKTTDIQILHPVHKPDTPGVKKTDTSAVKKFDPRKATIRSAILPGWGQAYNKKYWKIPIVYAALGISAGVFFSNMKTYKQLRDAVIWRQDTNFDNDTLIAPDLQHLSVSNLIFYRNTFRQYIDYSALAFLLFWGLNVVDATVDAHLKSFDVTPDLSMKIKPMYHFESGITSIGLIFSFRERTYKFNKPH